MFGLVSAAPAAAALPAECDSSGTQVVCTFGAPTGTGFVGVPFVVPAWVSTAQFDLRGGAGGSGQAEVEAAGASDVDIAAGGRGATVSAVRALVPGETLQFFVGGAGNSGTARSEVQTPGGVNGGGLGLATPRAEGAEGFSAWAAAGGGGGGSFVMRGSDLPTTHDPVVAAAGGGGGSPAAIVGECIDDFPTLPRPGSAGGSGSASVVRGDGQDGVAASVFVGMPQQPTSCAVVDGGGGGGWFGGMGADRYSDGGARAAGGGTNFPAASAEVTHGVAAEAGPGQIRITFAKEPVAIPNCDGIPATIVGTSGHDRLIGTSGRDVIVGLGGNDVIRGKGGNDLICGGDGNDTIRGNAGRDQIDGGAGNDKINGDGGRDVIKGGTGNDRLSGEGGRDDLYGQDGNDTLRGGGGDDFLHGGPGNDRASGGRGENTFTAIEMRFE